MVSEGKWPGNELVSCRLLSLEKFLWRLCTMRAAARNGCWEEARRHHHEAVCFFDSFYRSGTVTVPSMTEISASLDGVGTSIYNRDTVWVENHVDEASSVVSEFVNPEFVRWIKTGHPEETRDCSKTRP
ncbi:MAG: hypothetical protein MAG715_00775 [Methanonatronarchaeales archaeon]|nr:hypothetical protein [Methanonatronarchaeales archaeon]